MVHKARGGRQGLHRTEELLVGYGTLFAMGLGVVFFVPALTWLLGWVENRRSGETARQRELLGGGLASAQARSFVNAAWTLWLTVLVLPFGLLPRTGLLARLCPRVPAPQGVCPVPVILVHGLYHNPAAWFVLRVRLARMGFAEVRCFGYASFGRSFEAIAADLAELLLAVGKEAPGGRVALVGHSLGGLLIRAACADARVACGKGCRVAGVVTLGTPHGGSTLAGMLGLGRLARGLAPGGEVISLVRALPCFPGPGLSLYTPTDGMVLPLSGSFLDERELAAGWAERALPPTSHVGLLYSRAAAGQIQAFLRGVCSGVG
ncbi:esterase/lipase family protein [Humidesulfovibrio sp.]